MQISAAIPNEDFSAERSGDAQPRFVAGLPVDDDRPNAGSLQQLQVQQPERAWSDNRRLGPR